MSNDKGNKVKIFIFLVFIVFAIVFVTELFGFLKIGFGTINDKKQEITCSNYKILDIDYINNRLYLEVQTRGANLSKITVVDDMEREHVMELQPKILSGNTGNVVFNNITLNKEYTVYLEDCKNYGKKYEI